MRGITFFFLFVSFSSLHSQTITLRDTTNQYDYIIITVPEFVSACEPFRQHKETVRDFRTLIVDTTQIFAEFDSSAAPEDNIRNFISYAGTFWLQPRPKFFLIVGTVSDVLNFLIPFPSPDTIYFYSDYYYCQSVYEDDPTTTDFYIGRIPCKDESEINNYFFKVIDYETNDTIYSWMNNVLFLCAGEDASSLNNVNYALGIATTLPPYIGPFYIAENDTSQYYGNIDSIYKAINLRGNSVVWLLGLSDDPYIGGSDWITPEDLNGFTNIEKYFVTFSTGRQSAILDTNINLTQAMMMLPNAGSLGGGVFVGYTFYGIGKQFTYNWASKLFDPTFNDLGEIFVSDNLPIGGFYDYVRKVANLWADPSLKLKYDETVDVEEITENVPGDFVLFANYPNPFNPTTKISWQSATSSQQTLKVYDVLGNEVATLVDEYKPAGKYEVEFNADDLPSGIYFYKLVSGTFIQTKKMILLK
jgi:hypothetical protein